MLEVAHAGKGHGETLRIARGNHRGVLHRASGLHNGSESFAFQKLNAVGKGKKRVAGKNRTVEWEACLLEHLANGIHSVREATGNGNGLITQAPTNARSSLQMACARG